MGGGVGLIDYDGDGWLDVYFVNGCRLPVDPVPPAPNRLFRSPQTSFKLNLDLREIRAVGSPWNEPLPRIPPGGMLSRSVSM